VIRNYAVKGELIAERNTALSSPFYLMESKLHGCATTPGTLHGVGELLVEPDLMPAEPWHVSLGICVSLGNFHCDAGRQWAFADIERRAELRHFVGRDFLFRHSILLKGL